MTKICIVCTTNFDGKECPTCKKRRGAAWYSLNKENVKTRAKRWAESNPDKRKVIESKYRSENPLKAKLRGDKWRRDKPELSRRNVQNYRARKRANGGILSKDVASRLFNLQKGKCACCGEPLGDNYHLDHIVPINLGGANEDWNIQLLRQRCNNQKHDMHPVDFMQLRGFLI